MAFSGNCLQVEGFAQTSDPGPYIEVDFSSTPEVWVSFDVEVNPAYLSHADGSDGSSPAIVGVQYAGGPGVGTYFLSAIPDGSGGYLWFGGEGLTLGTAVANTAYTFEMGLRRNDGGADGGFAEFYIDGSLANSVTPSSEVATGYTRVRVGALGDLVNDTAAISWVDNFKVGTTRGGSDLWALDDFESGSLTSYTVNDPSYVSIVAGPGGGTVGTPTVVVSDSGAAIPTLIGSGTGGSTLSITVDVAVPADGALQLVYAGYTQHLTEDNLLPATTSDSNYPTTPAWTLPTGIIGQDVAPLVGEAAMDTSVWSSWTPGSSFDRLWVGSVGRGCTAGDLQPGDTVSATFNGSSGNPFPGTIEALLVYVPAFWLPVGARGGDTDYDNGYGHPNINDGTVAPSTQYGVVLWQDGQLASPFAIVYPDADALMVVAAASSTSGSGFSPSHPGAGFSAGGRINCNVVTYVPAGMVVEPGGSFSTGSDLVVANYQFMKPRKGSGIQAWQRF